MSEIFEKFNPIEQERFRLEFYETREWESFLQNLSEVINSLLLADVFADNEELEKECKEVLSLVDNKDVSQPKKYYDLVGKISTFFFERNIYIHSKLPD